jgi:hypothetical protein
MPGQSPWWSCDAAGIGPYAGALVLGAFGVVVVVVLELAA